MCFTFISWMCTFTPVLSLTPPTKQLQTWNETEMEVISLNEWMWYEQFKEICIKDNHKVPIPKPTVWASLFLFKFLFWFYHLRLEAWHLPFTVYLEYFPRCFLVILQCFSTGNWGPLPHFLHKRSSSAVCVVVSLWYFNMLFQSPQTNELIVTDILRGKISPVLWFQVKQQKMRVKDWDLLIWLKVFNTEVTKKNKTHDTKTSLKIHLCVIMEVERLKKVFKQEVSSWVIFTSKMQFFVITYDWVGLTACVFHHHTDVISSCWTPPTDNTVNM